MREKPVTKGENVEALQATLRGTVWKRNSPLLENSYTKGSDKPTALRLSDSIMRSAYNKTQGFGKGRLKRDESWANDLSLADMGLTREATSSGHRNGEMDEGEDEDEDGNEEDEVVEEDSLDVESNLGIANPEKEEHIRDESTSGNPVDLLASKGSQSLEILVSPEVQNISDRPFKQQVSRKRRRVVSVAERSKEQVLPSPEISELSDGTLDADESTTPKSRKRRRKLTEGNTTNVTSQESVIQKDHEQKLPNSGPGRKRKLSPESSAVEPTARTRIKRAGTGTTSR